MTTSIPKTPDSCWYSYSEVADEADTPPYPYTLSLSVIVDPELLRGYSAKRLVILSKDKHQAIEEIQTQDSRLHSKRSSALIQTIRTQRKTKHLHTYSSVVPALPIFNVVLEIVEEHCEPSDGRQRVTLRQRKIVTPDDRILFEKIIPSDEGEQFFVVLIPSPDLRHQIRYGFAKRVEMCIFHVLPLQPVQQSVPILLDRLSPAVLSSITAWLWPYSRSYKPRECKAIFIMASVRPSWSYLAEVYVKKAALGYTIYKPKLLLKTLEDAPEKMGYLKHCMLHVTGSQNIPHSLAPAYELASLLKLKLPLTTLHIDRMVFLRSLDYLPAFPHLKRLRLLNDRFYPDWDEETSNTAMKLLQVSTNWPELVDLELCGIRGPSDSDRELQPYPSFSAPFKLETLSWTHGDQSWHDVSFLLCTKPSLRSLKMGWTYRLFTDEMETLLSSVSTTLEELTLEDHSWNARSDPGAAFFDRFSLDRILPSLKRLRYLEVRNAIHSPCISTTTIASKPPLENTKEIRAKLVVYPPLAGGGITMAKALEVTGWRHIEFRGRRQDQWEALREEWVEIAERRDIKITFSYEHTWANRVRESGRIGVIGYL